jgi:hypothetical protein
VKIPYLPVTLKADSLATVAQANTIITEYQNQGYDLTLRQLYYQFVSRGLIPNRQREYDRLGRIVSDARLQGLIDWDSINDRTRAPRTHQTDADPKQTIRAIGEYWTVDLWRDQPERVEVWIEKDALASVLDRVCPGLDVSYFACKGYVSQSAMWRASQRHRRYERAGQRVTVLHLGDHDPSGIDMTRDITDRLTLFGTSTTVKRIALTMDQVQELQPPPNPAKLSDSRAREYVEEYGSESWELDALDPAAITELVESEVLEHRDEYLWEEAQARQTEEGQVLRNVAERWDDVVELVGD